jgi:quercetin dioxygenase-like cupin family protein
MWRRTLPAHAHPDPGAAPFIAIKVDTMAWGEANMHPPLQWFRKRLVNDTSARGIYVSLLRYPAGVINPSHTHPHPHGFYVLQGQLVTSRGTFGPGTFVWFPAGEVIQHGAGPKEDMVAIFISGAPFEINYVSR